MFGFEKLEVYNLTHQQYIRLNRLLVRLFHARTELELVAALKTINLEMVQSFVRGSFHIDPLEKKQCYTIARGALFQAVSLLKILRDLDGQAISEEEYNELYVAYESLSRMMLTLIKNRTAGANGNGNCQKNFSSNYTKDSCSGSHQKSTYGGEDDFSSSGSGDDNEFLNFNKLEIGE